MWELPGCVVLSSSPSKAEEPLHRSVAEDGGKGQQFFWLCSPANVPALLQVSVISMRCKSTRTNFVCLSFKTHSQPLQCLSRCGRVPVLRGAPSHVPHSNHLSRTKLIISSHAEKLPAGGTCFHLPVFVRLWHEVNSCRIYQMSLCGVGCFVEWKRSSVYT